MKADPVPNVLDQNCPTRQVLNRIADKWSVLVLILLQEKKRRFNELKRQVGGISQKMLSQTLKQLERDGLVKRTAFPTVPVTVEYEITPLGATLADAVDGLRIWAESHLKDVAAAQTRYDAKAG